MSIIDRFTRDDISAKVWWPVALLLFVLFLLTFPAQNLVVQREREDATSWVNTSMGGLAADLGSVNFSGSIGDASAGSVRVAAETTLLSHPQIEAVRIWASDGRLLVSTDPGDTIGSSEYLNDESLNAALDADGVPSWGVSTASLSDVPGPPTLEVYVAVPGAEGSAGVVEVRIPDGPMLAELRSDWRGYRLTLGLAAALAFLLAGLSMREPVARVGAGVRFYPESVPTHLAVIDRDMEVELRQSGAVARSRVEGMMGRLRESEEARLVLEGRLQTALSELAGRPRRAAPTGAAETRKPVVRLPEPEPEPIQQSAPKPVPAAEPEVAAVVEPEVAAVIEPVVVVPEVAEASEEPEGSLGADWLLELQVEAEVEPVSDGVLVIPEASADHEETAVEVLNRLVEPVGAGVELEADPGEMRSRLARTAALKKPGSRSEERFRDVGVPEGEG